MVDVHFIEDFGLSRAVESDYYKASLKVFPIKVSNETSMHMYSLLSVDR
jgi:hypothetical protein